MPHIAGLTLSQPEAASPTASESNSQGLAQSVPNGQIVSESELLGMEGGPSGVEWGTASEGGSDGVGAQVAHPMPTDPDGVVEYCLMAGLHSVADAELPIMTSDFYSKHMLPNKPPGAHPRPPSTLPTHPPAHTYTRVPVYREQSCPSHPPLHLTPIIKYPSLTAGTVSLFKCAARNCNAFRLTGYRNGQ